LAKEIIQATTEAAGIIPVSIKTRIGFDQIITEEWVEFLLRQNIQALTVHGRTAKEKSRAPAHWNEIRKVVGVRDRLGAKTVIIGNGDVRDRNQAVDLVHTYGVDGVMIGRGIFHNLWAFSEVDASHLRSPKTVLKLLLKHLQLFEKEWGSTKPFHILKKYFKIYVQGFVGAVELREKLMQTNSCKEVEKIISYVSKM
ncbi:MAG: tRNA-dihydrouridine synthase, partial [Patescibacteria group bacterium]